MSKAPRPLSRVLVPVDFSPFTAHVLDRVVHLPWGVGGELSLLHVTRSGDASEERAQLDALVAQTAARVPLGLRVSGTVVAGLPFQVIAARARELDVDLVALGRHGHRAFADALVGSTAERVVRTCPAPVLIVNQASTLPYRRVLAAMDLSKAARAALETSLRLLDPHWAEVRLVHADGHDERYLGAELLDLCARYESRRIGFEVAERRDDPRPALLAELRAHPTDLLALGTHGQTSSLQLILGSVTDAMLRAAACDVLVARARA